MSGNFTERGDVSIINKWNKTKIALDNNIDIVVELPYLYATQSADYFAYAALKILNELKIDTLVFGSECNDINKLYNLANLQLENDNKIKDIINSNINYPKAISNIYNENIDKPNDILGISYIKEIIKNNYNIKPYTIKRTNDYNSNELAKICSSSALRSALKNGIDIKSYIPYDISLIEYKDLNDYFNLIKYQIISNDNLNNIFGVDEGIENRFKKYIFDSNNLDDFILKVKCKCLICNYEWDVQASHILSGHGCPVCGNSIKKTHQQFVNEMNIVNPNIKIISEYINAFTKVKCKCKICSKEWDAVPNSLLNGTGCPQCKLSKGELKISKYLDNHDICYISQYKFDNCKNERVLPFDFYLPDYNICIEDDGELHYKVVEQFGGKEYFDSVQKHDNIKTQYCKDNKIKLIRIPYWEFYNIENILKKEILHNEIN